MGEVRRFKRLAKRKGQPVPNDQKPVVHQHQEAQQIGGLNEWDLANMALVIQKLVVAKAQLASEYQEYRNAHELPQAEETPVPESPEEKA